MGKMKVEALRGISFYIDKGEFVAIMGPSGSGKSTLMHIIGCLDQPTEGNFIIGGKDVSKLNDDRLAEIRNKRIGFIFQQFNLLSRTSILHNVEIPLIYAGVKAKQRRGLAKQALENVGLGDRVKHKPNEISGGEKQRAAIARALVNNPLIILADEPTGNLDPETSWEIMQLLEQINVRGTTVLVATHDSQMVDRMKKRVIQLDAGYIVRDEHRGTYKYCEC